MLDEIHTLPLPVREAVLLRYYQDMGPTQIAQTLHVPLQTVKTRLKRGKVLLRAQLEGAVNDD